MEPGRPSWQTDGTPGYAALQIIDPNTGDTHYGWVQFVYSGDFLSNSNAAITLIDFAYNDIVGASILTGQVPEPSSTTLLLGLGMLGWVVHRRLRQASSS